MTRDDLTRLIDDMPEAELPLAYRLLTTVLRSGEGMTRDQRDHPLGEEQQLTEASPDCRTNAEALYADLLPEDETPDMLIAAVERWRRASDA